MLYVDVVSESGDEVKQAPGLLVVMILKSDPQFRVLGKLVKYVAQNTKANIQFKTLYIQGFKDIAMVKHYCTLASEYTNTIF